jgi:hypothetical protein
MVKRLKLKINWSNFTVLYLDLLLTTILYEKQSFLKIKINRKIFFCRKDIVIITICVCLFGYTDRLPFKLFIIHIYHSRFISARVEKTSQIFLRDIVPKYLSNEEYCRRDRCLANRRLIAVHLR